MRHIFNAPCSAKLALLVSLIACPVGACSSGDDHGPVIGAPSGPTPSTTTSFSGADNSGGTDASGGDQSMSGGMAGTPTIPGPFGTGGTSGAPPPFGVSGDFGMPPFGVSGTSGF